MVLSYDYEKKVEYEKWEEPSLLSLLEYRGFVNYFLTSFLRLILYTERKMAFNICLIFSRNNSQTFGYSSTWNNF